MNSGRNVSIFYLIDPTMGRNERLSVCAAVVATRAYFAEPSSGVAFTAASAKPVHDNLPRTDVRAFAQSHAR
jgi:hypothetical protein